MIEQVSTPPPGRMSLFEEELQRFLWRLPYRFTVVDFEPHGRRGPAGCAPADGDPTDSDPGDGDPAADGDAADGEPAGEASAGRVAAGGGEAPLEARMASLAGLLAVGAGHLAVAAAASREQCRQAAVQARALAAFAAHRPAVLIDRPDAEVGAAAAASRAGRPAALTAVSEWAVDEVMVALGLSSAAAGQLLERSVTVVERLPATLAALEAGTVSWAHAVMLADVLAPLTDPRIRAGVEAGLLAGAAGTTVPQLRAAARRAVLRADAAAAARRLAAAIRDRQVRVFAGEDGMAALSATMPIPVAAACRRALAGYAAACKVPGDERSTDQRMVDCLADLILRPDAERPPVQIDLTMVAGVTTLTGGDEPGEIDGHPVPAVLVRELAHTLGLLPRPEAPATPADRRPRTARPATTDPATTDAGDADPATAEPANAAPGNTDAENTAAEDADPGDTADAAVEPTTGRPTPGPGPDPGEAAAGLARLLGTPTTAGTPLAHPPTIAIVEEISGQLLALTTTAELRRTATCRRPACRTGRAACPHPPSGPGLGPPPPTPGYGPAAALQRFVRARDRRCRFPGCRAAAIRCDLDHNLPWPAGPTSAANLCCLCRHHHRLSHQAPGWCMRRLPDGGLHWTTPGGQQITTHPPRYGTDDHHHPPPATTPPAASPAAPPLTATERVLGRPHPPGTIDPDPAPF